MSEAIRVVAPCGCTWQHYGRYSGWWAADRHCQGAVHVPPALKGHLLYTDAAVPIVRMGYLIAASQGRGPWAKHWPGKP